MKLPRIIAKRIPNPLNTLNRAVAISINYTSFSTSSFICAIDKISERRQKTIIAAKKDTEPNPLN